MSRISNFKDFKFQILKCPFILRGLLESEIWNLWNLELCFGEFMHEFQDNELRRTYNRHSDLHN
jgi:hypothetical protein